jgi:Subtilase family
VFEEWLIDGTPPPRVGPLLSYHSRSAEELWQWVSRSQSAAVVGLKDPDMRRGIFRGRILITSRDIDRAVERVAQVPGVTVSDRSLAPETVTGRRYPAVAVTIGSPEALATLCAIAEVDYVEPLHITFDGVGCKYFDYHGDPGDEDFSPEPGVAETNRVPWNFRHMEVQDCWGLFTVDGRIVAPGRGITIGVVDTGTYPDQVRLNEGFDLPPGTRSPPQHIYVDDPPVECSHGTRIAGLATAPADGVTSNYVGVAWGSDLVTAKINNGVVTVGGTDIFDVVRGVESVIGAGARIITMAFGLPFESQYLRDNLVRIYEEHPNVLLVGAAGTSVSDVAFPATMEREVVTVTIVDYKPTPPYTYVRRGASYFPDQVAYGPAVDFAAVHSDNDVPTTGDAEHALTTIGGSSCATALIGGILALAWARLPMLSRDELIQRLAESSRTRQIEDAGESSDGRTKTVGWGIPDAYRAAGGARQLWIEGPNWIASSSYQLVARLDGHYSLYDFSWNSGETAETIIANANGTTPRTHTVVVTNRHDGRSLTASVVVPVSQTARLGIASVFAEGGGDTASVEWITDKPATGTLDYGTSGGYGFKARSGPPAMISHNVVLHGLRPKAHYQFLITCTAPDGSSATETGGFYNPAEPL